MFKLALLIFIVSLLISKNSIEGDRNVNHRSLQSGNIQDLQPVNHFGNYPSRDEPINHSGNQGKEKRRSFLIEKRHQPLKSKPDPEKIPNVEKRKFLSSLSVFHQDVQIPTNTEDNIINRDLVRSSLSIPSNYFLNRGFTPEILEKYDEILERYNEN